MTNRVRFSSRNAVPPGGKFFCELAGRRYEGGSLSEICGALRPELVRLRISAAPEDFVAAYMCPRLGSVGQWFCKGLPRRPPGTPGMSDSLSAMRESERMFSMPVVPAEDTVLRLRRCLSCPMHSRKWCITCPGHLQRILDGFGGSRQRNDLDVGSGVCLCSGAYEAAVCSVDWGKSPVWADAPETCWRRG